MMVNLYLHKHCVSLVHILFVFLNDFGGKKKTRKHKHFFFFFLVCSKKTICCGCVCVNNYLLIPSFRNIIFFLLRKKLIFFLLDFSLFLHCFFFLQVPFFIWNMINCYLYCYDIINKFTLTLFFFFISSDFIWQTSFHLWSVC